MRNNGNRYNDPSINRSFKSMKQMTTKKIIKYNNKTYTFHRDEDGHIHPSGEDYESVEYLIENREAVVEYIVKKMNYKLPKKEICCLCN